MKLFGLNRLRKNLPEGNSRFVLVFLLGCIEFFIAALVILLINKDPKNAFLFGFSLSRLILFMVTLAVGIGLFVLAVNAYFGKKGVGLSLVKKVATWTDISFLLLLIGCMIALLNSSMLGSFKFGFERLRPLLLAVSFFPIQLSFTQLSRVKWKYDKSLWLPAFSFLLATLLLTGFIVITRLGITPDKIYWNVAGMPLSSIQLVMILVVTLICLELITIVRRYLPAQKIYFLDLGLCLLLFGSAVLVWNLTPFDGHFFTDISWPLNQPFPFSDARGRDLGALSITIGQGISFNEHTVSPLLEVFLATLHGIAGYDYNLISQLQLLILAGIPVGLYLVGKTFDNRLLGLFIASIVIVRQSNAILLSRMIAGSNPYLLTTEMPTYLALTVFTVLVFWWLKKSHKSVWAAFFSGAVLGMASLIRVNPIALLPAIPFIALAVMWKTKKKWLIQVTVFFLGFLLMVVPWILTGTTEDGQSFFLQKFYNVLDERYNPSGYLPQAEKNSFNISPLSSRARLKIAIERNGEAVTLVDIYQFPGFVVNHFLHNIVTSVLALPDSISPADQVLEHLALRPYWVEQEPWFGELETGQKVFLIINLLLISLGMGWSWKRWKWTGMLPIYIFLVYLVSMGFARVSGSRYIVPVDWVIFFYYAIGLKMLFGWMAKVLKLKIQPEFETPDTIEEPSPSRKRFQWFIIPSLVLLMAVSASTPVADNLIPPDDLLCNNDALLDSSLSVYKGDPDQVNFLIGRMLYPTINENTLTFTFLTCQRVIELTIKEFTSQISSGQLIVMVLQYPVEMGEAEMMISMENDAPLVMWENK